MAGSRSLPDPRGRSLARLLNLETVPQDRARLAALIVDRATQLGAALADEAVRSDDVHDEPSANRYLELRLRMLADLMPAGALPELRRAFVERVRSW